MPRLEPHHIHVYDGGVTACFAEKCYHRDPKLPRLLRRLCPPSLIGPKITVVKCVDYGRKTLVFTKQSTFEMEPEATS